MASAEFSTGKKMYDNVTVESCPVSLIIDHLGIDEEGHRHFDGLVGFQRLLREAEAFDLLEVEPHRLAARR